MDGLDHAGEAPRFAFGPFELCPRERTLKQDGALLRLSDKPLDILIVLVARAGELVGREELLATVWPDVTVGEGTLRVHLVALRKVLGETGGEARYIVNVAGRGYQFIAPVTEVRSSTSFDLSTFDSDDHARPPQAPVRPLRRSDMIIGRDAILERLSNQVPSRRLNTIVGPGGVGKSTVAQGVAEQLRTHFEEVRFLDLASLSDVQLLPTALALAFHVRVPAGDAITVLTQAIVGRRILLVLDGCEHLIETTALIIERLLESLPELQILATSREPLRLSQERVYRLAPLGAAPLEVATADELMDYPAAQLFVERALAAWQEFELSDANAPTISRICHALDGLPLAIELAVGQLPFLGLDDLARGLIDPLPILGRGRRTASPRQRTLRATLDWSYDLLSHDEQLTLRRLGVFRGRFDLDGATAIATCPRLEAWQILEAMAGLVAKSIVGVDYDEGTAVYKLLDTTRAYARSRLEQAGEWNDASRQHAQYIMKRLRPNGDEMRGQVPLPRVRDSEIVDDVRAALVWAHEESSDGRLLQELTLAVTFVLAQRSSLDEARMYLQRAFDRLEPSERGTLTEFNLRLYLNTTSPIIGSSDENLSALLDLARKLDEPGHVARTLELAFLTRLRVADYRAASVTADHLGSILRELGEAAPKLNVEWMMGVAAHYQGDYRRAEAEFRSVLAAQIHPDAIRFSGHPAAYAHCFLARTLWAIGQESDALAHAEEALALLPDVRNPMIACTILVWLSQLYFWSRDFDRVVTLCVRVKDIARAHSMDTQLVLAGIWEARVALARGVPDAPLPLLAEYRRHLTQNQQDMLTPMLHAAFAEAWLATGDAGRALTEVEGGLTHVATTGADIFRPELLLIKARVLGSATDGTLGDPIEALQGAMNAAAKAGARFWETQAALELMRQAIASGRAEIASGLRASVTARDDLQKLTLMGDIRAL